MPEWGTQPANHYLPRAITDRVSAGDEATVTQVSRER